MIRETLPPEWFTPSEPSLLRYLVLNRPLPRGLKRALLSQSCTCETASPLVRAGLSPARA